jgi:signal peptidase II
VVDFIEVGVQAYRFPVFNAADSAVTVGVCWLLLMNFRASPKSAEEAETHAS